MQGECGWFPSYYFALVGMLFERNWDAIAGATSKLETGIPKGTYNKGKFGNLRHRDGTLATIEEEAGLGVSQGQAIPSQDPGYAKPGGAREPFPNTSGYNRRSLVRV
ncbi:hypothetical protein LTR85_012137 [Meristemomyces frigidus]|nr:hypothetical protein LTR85_012137 [Meristemomyces frigidus]